MIRSALINASFLIAFSAVAWWLCRLVDKAVGR